MLLGIFVVDVEVGLVQMFLAVVNSLHSSSCSRL